MECGNLNISGGGSKSPATVSIPGGQFIRPWVWASLTGIYQRTSRPILASRTTCTVDRLATPFPDLVSRLDCFGGNKPSDHMTTGVFTC